MLLKITQMYCHSFPVLNGLTIYLFSVSQMIGIEFHSKQKKQNIDKMKSIAGLRLYWTVNYTSTQVNTDSDDKYRKTIN